MITNPAVKANKKQFFSSVEFPHPSIPLDIIIYYDFLLLTTICFGDAFSSLCLSLLLSNSFFLLVTERKFGDSTPLKRNTY